jgi:hypothetical protein
LSDVVNIEVRGSFSLLKGAVNSRLVFDLDIAHRLLTLRFRLIASAR